MTHGGLQKVVGCLRREVADRPADSELLERFVNQRDESAFAELVARHGPKVFAVCRRVLDQHQLAEDAFQATFLVLVKRAHSIQPRSAVGGFLYGVARRAALEAFAVSRRRKETLVGKVPDSPTAARAVVEPDVLAMLDEEIANLSETLRASVVLCELDGVSRADAARQLGIAEGTLSSRLAAARKQLAERLTKRGVVLSATVLAALANSATASVPPVLQTRSAAAAAIAGGVMKTMMLAKLKATVALGVLLTAFVAWALVPSAAPTGTAAPVPKPPPADKGVIWVHHPKANNLATLTAYTPDGKKEDELTIHDGDCYLGFTPDGRKIAFVGKGGKLVDSPNGKGLTVHLQEIGDAAKVTDTGIPAGEDYTPPVWFPDMKRIAYARITKPADGSILWSLKFVVLDLTTKKETPLGLPADHVVTKWSPDGSWLLAIQGNAVWRRYTLADGKLQTITEKRFYFYMDLSPDGKTLIGYGEGRQGVVGGPRIPWEIDRFDVATGKMTKTDKFAHTPNDMIVMSRWSLDGKRVVHLVRERAPDEAGGEESYRIVVCDPDGGNEVKLTAGAGQFMGWIYWLPSRSKPAVRTPK